MDNRKIGLPEDWNDGIVEVWNTGSLEYWKIEIVEDRKPIVPSFHYSILEPGT
jgi:hypothetical protein